MDISIFLDLLVISLCVYFVIIGYRKGLVKSLLNFVSSILSFFISMYLSSFISVFIYDNFIRNSLINKISNILINSANEEINTRISLLMGAIPKFLANSLGTYGVTSGNIADQLNVSSNIAAVNITNMMAPAIINLIRIISVFVLFMVFAFLFSHLSKFINRIARFPVLKQINNFLGGTFGFFEYSIFVFTACLLIRIFVPMVGSTPVIFSDETIEETFIFKQIYYNHYYDNFIEAANNLY